MAALPVPDLLLEAVGIADGFANAGAAPGELVMEVRRAVGAVGEGWGWVAGLEGLEGDFTAVFTVGWVVVFAGAFFTTFAATFPTTLARVFTVFFTGALVDALLTTDRLSTVLLALAGAFASILLTAFVALFRMPFDATFAVTLVGGLEIDALAACFFGGGLLAAAARAPDPSATGRVGFAVRVAGAFTRNSS